MSATVAPASQTPMPPRRTWTGEEFEWLADAGLFGPEEHLELVNGEIVTKMTQNSPHATALTLTQDALRVIFPAASHVLRNQMPLALGKRDRPEPDIAVVPGSARDFVQSHPTTALLVVEISDTTLLYDQTEKLGVYARAGITEYWIVNLRQRVLEVHRQPEPVPDAPLGHSYRQVLRLAEDETVSPVSGAVAALAVAELLP